MFRISQFKPTQNGLSQPTPNPVGPFKMWDSLGQINSVVSSQTTMQESGTPASWSEETMEALARKLQERDQDERHNTWHNSDSSGRAKREASAPEKKTSETNDRIEQCRDAESLIKGIKMQSGWLASSSKNYWKANSFYKNNGCENLLKDANEVERRQKKKAKALELIEAEKDPQVKNAMIKELEAQEAMERAKSKYAAALTKDGTVEQLEYSQIERLADELNSNIHSLKKAIKHREKAQSQSRLPKCRTKKNKPGRQHIGLSGFRFCKEDGA